MQDISFLKANLPYYLQSIGVDVQKASRNNTACPICGNGVKTGCFHYYDDSHRVKCFSCGFSGDLIDIIAVTKNLSKSEAIREAQNMYVGIDSNKYAKSKSVKQRTEPEQIDYSDFFLKAEKNNNFKYLQERGISSDTQRYFHIGFVSDWCSPKVKENIILKGGNPQKIPTSPRCIIPRNKYNYLARDVRSNSELTDEQKKYIKQNTGRTSLFNSKALNENHIFITEGEIDAMSIVEVGGNACALCSTANRQLLLNLLNESNNQDKVFILMLDNDDSGCKATEELSKELKKLGISHLKADYPPDIKDPNQWLITDRESFQYGISFFEDMANKIIQEQKGNKYNAIDLLEYFKTIEQQPIGFEAQTGFEALDKNLAGGLHEGLYIIGAISSLGKTTFLLQIADQIATKGQDVIFFSLEMSKYELMAKSISRYTYQMVGDTTTGENDKIKPLARDTQQILNNRRYRAYNDDEKELIRLAIGEYEKAASNIFIYEGRYKGKRLKVENIREIVKQHIQTTKRKPVVFVDYLQIIAPADPRATDKQNTDTNTFELKEISRDYQIPVFAVSSFNRDNYQEPVSMQSFKESGAIEYSSDVLFGLQYAGMDYQEGESSDRRKKRLRDLIEENFKKKRDREPIDVELKCLKQRTGYQFSLGFSMMPAYNYFEPKEDLKETTVEEELEEEVQEI